MSVRKNLSDVQAQDLLLKWRYETPQGVDVYEIHTLADYRLTSVPLGTLSLNPVTGVLSVEVRKGMSGRFHAIGPVTGDSDDA